MSDYSTLLYPLPEQTSNAYLIPLTYNGRRFTKSALCIFAGYYPLSVYKLLSYLWSSDSQNMRFVLIVLSLFSEISVLLTTENSDDLEIWVPDGQDHWKLYRWSEFRVYTQNIGLSNHKLKSALKCTVWSQCTALHARPRRTDRRTNITAIARRFVLTIALAR